MLYLLIPALYLFDICQILYNKISPRQSRHINPGGLHVMTGELSDHRIQSADTFC